MQELYRIIIKPYNFDHWDIFTQDKAVFSKISEFYSYDEAVEHFGEEWDTLVDAFLSVEFPYVLLGETELRQYG